MGWFSPKSICALALLTLAAIAVPATGDEIESFDSIGLSYFEQSPGDIATAEFVHYLMPADDVQSSIDGSLDVPELLPPLPAEPTLAKQAEAETVEKPEGEKKDPPEDGEEEGEPVEEEPSYGYLDYVPYGQYGHIDYWLGESKWSKSAELGLNGQTGNTESNSLRVGSKIKREGQYTIFTSEFKHLRTAGPQGLTQNNAFFKHKLEWPLKVYKDWSLYENTNLEYDEFKAFDLRLVFNGGVSYKAYKTDMTDFTLNGGAGFNQEFGSPQKGIVPEANLGFDFNHSITVGQKLAMNFDFYPSMEADQGYRFTNEASYTVAIREGLSLKISANDRYDSTPNNRKRNDLDYACLLLWEF
ncbi:DUF481 domain-containing protein [Bremerella cremea]|uniref:DUF481 domain-containing protein n=1 Tax=Bremerella cremea TaxID=1031537 RepID=UPI0031EECDBB